MLTMIGTLYIWIGKKDYGHERLRERVAVSVLKWPLRAKTTRALQNKSRFVFN